MTGSSNNTRPASPVASLTAPQMSTSSSKSSLVSNVWSEQTSRRGSDASSTTHPAETLTAEMPKPAAAPAAPAVSAPIRRLAPPNLVHSGDPLSRTYPKPDGNLDLDEALAREPLRWSLGHWRKHARDVVPESANVQSEASKKQFQDTKDELRRLQASLQSGSKRL